MATAGALPRQSRGAWGHFALTFPCPFPRQHSTQELIILGSPPCKCQTLAGETFGDAGGYRTEKPEMNRSARLDLRPSRGSQNTVPAAFRRAEDRPQPRLPCHPPSFSCGPFPQPHVSSTAIFPGFELLPVFSLESQEILAPAPLYFPLQSVPQAPHPAVVCSMFRTLPKDLQRAFLGPRRPGGGCTGTQKNWAQVVARLHSIS